MVFRQKGACRAPVGYAVAVAAYSSTCKSDKKSTSKKRKRSSSVQIQDQGGDDSLEQNDSHDGEEEGYPVTTELSDQISRGQNPAKRRKTRSRIVERGPHPSSSLSPPSSTRTIIKTTVKARSQT
ncbi:hypothetical protein CVT25_003696 [Psilocybe cyanescens]|uniref:Uncharacterized protein n=1 Tax=Psilocybe cyanescens TaxID=93625 RepID=A0A409WP33_PSICY|nr:hypothetical protein CVT25_003696 [Psilocybe cyanescens]